MGLPGLSEPSARRRWLRGMLGGMLAAGAAAQLAPAHAGCERPPAQAGGGRHRLAVALGSGGAHWPAHVGVMRAFEARGARPDLIVGTSAGAIVGALWAAGLDAAAVERAARRYRLAEALSPGWTWFGGGRDERLRTALRELLPQQPIETWPTAFAAVATDLASGGRVVIDRGDAPSAVAASACVPMAFRPVEREGRRLVDGALVEPVPVRAARSLGALRVLAIDIAYRPGDEPVGGAIDIGFQTLHIMINALIDEQLAEADVPVRLHLHPLMRDRDDYAGLLIEAAQRAIGDAWPRILG
ncbi:MAG: patatin-like phospholipase family protein [Burkholderiales bacterium]|nr:patatin-like phospholipase family protein [Burkholderiales bacterium]